MQPIVMNLADMVDPNDPQGRTYCQRNAARVHAIPVGVLVEVRSLDPEEPDESDGVRLWVVQQCRDCDGSLLYCLSHDRDDMVQEREGFANRHWLNGMPEDWLTAVVPFRATDG